MALARLLFLLVFTCGLSPNAGFRLKRNKSSPASESLHLQEEEQGSAAELDDMTDEVAEEIQEEDDLDLLEEVEDEDDEIEEGEDSDSLMDSSTLVDRDSTDVSSQGAPARRRWNLLKPLNKTKADKLKKYLENKWSKDANNFPSYPAAGYIEALASRRKRGLESTFEVARQACWYTANYYQGLILGNPAKDRALKNKEKRDVAVIEAKGNLRGSSRLTGFIDQISHMATNLGRHAINKLKGEPWQILAKYQRDYERNSREAKQMLGHSDLYTQIFGMVKEMCWATARTTHWNYDYCPDRGKHRPLGSDCHLVFAKAYAYRDGMHKVLNDLMQQQKWPLYSR